MKARVLTIVVTYNAGPYIQQCLDSLLASQVKTDVLIIDNGSTDGTIKLIQCAFPELEMIQSPDNLGFGKANNIGLHRALSQEYDYAFLLNQDAWIQQDTFSDLIDFHEAHRDYGILSPLHLNAEGTAIDPKFSASLHVQNPYYLDDLLLGKVQPCYDVHFVNAALWLLPLDTLQNVGGFNEKYFMYGEDEDYCRRCLYQNLKIGIVPDNWGFHARFNACYHSTRVKNFLFTTQRWNRWSYKETTNLLKPLNSALITSLERAVKAITSALFKKQFLTAFAVSIGFIIFLLTLPVTVQDRKILRKRKAHFL